MKNFAKFGVFVFLILFGGSSVMAASFPDVSSGDENLKAIEFLKLEGVISGNPDGTFQPDRPLNRAELTKIVVEAGGYEILDDETCFPDVTSGEWYSKYVCTALKEGLVSGYPDGLFRPSNLINRAEASKIIAGALELDDFTGEIYKDVPDDVWFEGFVERNVGANVVVYDERFEPSELVLRRDFAEMYFRGVNLNKDKVFGYGHNDFVLDYVFPEVVVRNELFMINGTSLRDGLEIEVSSDSGTERFELGDVGDRFSIPLYFLEEGNYEVVIGNESFSINCVEDFVEENMSFSINDKREIFTGVDFFGENFSESSVVLNSDVVETDVLVAFEFVSKDGSLLVLNRQGLSSFVVAQEWLEEVWKDADKIDLQVAGAKLDGDKRSEFVELGNVELEVSMMLEVIVNNLEEYSLDFVYGGGDFVDVNFKPEKTVENTIFVMNDSFQIERVENVLKEAGEVWEFSYSPNLNSKFVVLEVNDNEGRALVNYPVYRRNVLPLRPDPFKALASANLEVNVEEALKLINLDRQLVGLNPLVLDAELSAVAEAHLDDMLKNKFVSHEGSDGRRVDERKLDFGIKSFVGENIARDLSLAAGHAALMRSASHRINILDPNWNVVGLAVYEDDLHGGIYLVQNFSLLVNDIDNVFDETIESSLKVEEESSLEGMVEDWVNLMVVNQSIEEEIAGRKLIDEVEDLGVYTNGVVITGSTILVDNAKDLMVETFAQFDEADFDKYYIGVEMDNNGLVYYALVLVK